MIQNDLEPQSVKPLKMEWLLASVVMWIFTIAVALMFSIDLDRHRWSWVVLEFFCFMSLQYIAATFWKRGAR